jgi:hypothetical protein
MKKLHTILTTLLLPLLAVPVAYGMAEMDQAEPAADLPDYDHSMFLPAVFGSGSYVFDMTRFMIGDGRLYEVRHSSGSQARHQTQVEDGRFYHTKGNEIRAEWEELWADAEIIYRGTDTSPGNDRYYTLYENDEVGSAWSPRYWKVGDLYERNPYVVFYRKADCRVVASGFQRSWLRFQAYYPAYTFASGIRLTNVIELSWLLAPDGDPIESYFYAQSYGLVGWSSADRGGSSISQIHAPGQRPDNTREVIGCLDRVADRLLLSPELNFGPLPNGYRAK